MPSVEKWSGRAARGGRGASASVDCLRGQAIHQPRVQLQALDLPEVPQQLHGRGVGDARDGLQNLGHEGAVQAAARHDERGAELSDPGVRAVEAQGAAKEAHRVVHLALLEAGPRQQRIGPGIRADVLAQHLLEHLHALAEVAVRRAGVDEVAVDVGVGPEVVLLAEVLDDKEGLLRLVAAVGELDQDRQREVARDHARL
mmetsp:Transcript_29286/g.77390  ORF Transcript_29286/g.77390 Transcript_29286/m.77390 type:complete len:200 (-) Transcript_29286:2691-3290(-)